MLLTVAIPTFNRPKTLKETLALNITSVPDSVELLVLNNGSDDRLYKTSENILRERANSRFIHFEYNGGWIESFKRAISFSNGDYVLLLSDEDVLQGEDWTMLFNAIEKYNSPMFALRSRPEVFGWKLKALVSDKNYHKMNRRELLTGCNYISGLIFQRELTLEQFKFLDALKHEEYLQLYPQVLLSWLLHCHSSIRGVHNPRVQQVYELPSEGVRIYGQYWLPTSRASQYLSALRCLQYFGTQLKGKELQKLKILEKCLKDSFFGIILLAVKTFEPTLEKDLVKSSIRYSFRHLFKSLFRLNKF